KIDLLAYCHQQQIPLLSCMGAGNKLDPTAFEIADLFATSVCPLAKILRQKLRAKGISSGIPVVFSTESPQAVGAAIGSVSFVPAVAGLTLASYVIKKLAGCS
ncbi:MAG: tRNA threonylcarbamoyladenosine dehydratase, partial [Clostridia bacterium]|nr:tRNA threonylcarbamoyladenosine dehydratase [Clostridia bacterium]